MSWRLIGPDGKPYESERPGTLGGHRRSRIYGRLDCPGALRWIAMYKEFLDAVRAASRLPTLVLDDGAPWDARYAAIRVFLGV